MILKNLFRKYGSELGEQSNFSDTLLDVIKREKDSIRKMEADGSARRQLAAAKKSLTEIKSLAKKMRHFVKPSMDAGGQSPHSFRTSKLSISRFIGISRVTMDDWARHIEDRATELEKNAIVLLVKNNPQSSM